MSRFEIKIVAALLLIAILPLGASVVLVGQVIRVSDSVAEGQSRRLERPLKQAADAYRRLFSALKETFRLRGLLLAQDADLLDALQQQDRAAMEERLGALLQQEETVGRLQVLDSGGEVLARASMEKNASPSATRHLDLDFPLGSGGHMLRAVFYTDLKPFLDFKTLGQVQNTAHQITYLRDELTTYYRVVFIIIFGAVLVLATGIGLFIARRTGRRVTALARATRKVAEGDLQTRVHLHTRDELGDLARAFNEMVGQIQESGERIAYLEKIGAWQEIARRLAHEIKNPLTPIQLAMQQVHQKYSGEDPKFARMLEDARDIITEEVDGLRRLVQAFSAFAKLPDVKPEPVDINALVDDFLKSRSEMQEMTSVQWSPLEEDVTVLLDRMMIKHVLFNLVENAVHAAEEVGTSADLQIAVTAEVDHKRGRLNLVVSDNGPGMEEQVAARVFDPYYTTKDRGTGLGLAIVKKIILEHKGSIDVSTEPGRGARFTITLPLAPGTAKEERVTLRMRVTKGKRS